MSEATHEEMKPCPFCGGEVYWSDVFFPGYIFCEDCDLDFHRGVDESMDELINRWNTRAE